MHLSSSLSIRRMGEYRRKQGELKCKQSDFTQKNPHCGYNNELYKVVHCVGMSRSEFLYSTEILFISISSNQTTLMTSLIIDRSSRRIVVYCVTSRLCWTQAGSDDTTLIDPPHHPVMQVLYFILFSHHLICICRDFNYKNQVHIWFDSSTAVFGLNDKSPKAIGLAAVSTLIAWEPDVI